MKVKPIVTLCANLSPDFSKVNLVHVVRQFAPMVGGLEDFVRNLVMRQLGQFASVKVITLDRLFTDLDYVLPHHEMIDGIEIVRIPFQGSPRYPVAPQVFRHLAGADLVHVHAIDFFYDALALTRPVHRHKMVATSHGGFFHTKAHSKLKKIWFNSVTRLSAHQYGGIACCSESDLELFAKIAPRRCRLIENGVELEKFANTASQKPVRHMVTVGRFSVNKRLDRVLDVLKRLVDENDSWKLDIIGSPSDLSIEALSAHVFERGLSDHVCLHTGLSNDEVGRVFARSSLFVSASDYEGFGIAMIEALSAGLVPVVHPNAAFKSLAGRHPGIHLTDFSNPVAAAQVIGEAMSQLECDPVLRSDVIDSAQQHSWSTTLQEYSQLYSDVLFA
ncbi:glycosyltransferase family 4 protein [Roseibium algae]|uniref:Glycosyltransferase family 4 protein n=1 Tax=Roseibium algae TaxID=3123038 RepID=A0ABU8TRX3_9HYPH